MPVYMHVYSHPLRGLPHCYSEQYLDILRANAVPIFMQVCILRTAYVLRIVRSTSV